MKPRGFNLTTFRVDTAPIVVPLASTAVVVRLSETLLSCIWRRLSFPFHQIKASTLAANSRYRERTDLPQFQDYRGKTYVFMQNG